jgi:DnaJ-like protein
MTNFPDFYTVLGVPPTATQTEIDAAYARLGQTNPRSETASHSRTPSVATVATSQLKEAYEILRHPAKRRDYDTWYHAWRAKSGTKSHEGEHTTHDLPHQCPRCDGSGHVRCLVCRGRGDTGCVLCHGRGTNLCVACLGTGLMSPVMYREFQEQRERAALRDEVTATGNREVAQSKRRAVAMVLSTGRRLALTIGLAVLVLGFYGAPGARPQLPLAAGKRQLTETAVAPQAATVPQNIITPPATTTPQTVSVPQGAREPAVVREMPVRPAAHPSPTRRVAGNPRVAGPRQARVVRKPVETRSPRDAAGAPVRPTANPDQAPAGPSATETSVRAPQPAATPDESWRIATVAAVESAIDQWSSTLLDADLHGHITFYSDRLERYFTERNVTWQAVYRDKRRLLLTYPVVIQYDVHNLQIVAETADRAVAIFDKSWDFRMVDNRRFAGEERQRLTLQLRDGRWRIVSEEELQVYWVVLPR